jgi:hypothetical protein
VIADGSELAVIKIHTAQATLRPQVWTFIGRLSAQTTIAESGTNRKLSGLLSISYYFLPLDNRIVISKEVAAFVRAKEFFRAGIRICH